MHEQPKFIKRFSKEESPEERQQAAREIETKRAEYFTGKKALAEQRAGLREDIGEKEKLLGVQLENIENLKAEIERVSDTFLGNFINYFKLKKLKADLAIGSHSYEELKRQRDQMKSEQQPLENPVPQEEVPAEFQEARQILENFYKQQKEKWAESEYTKEDMTKYFSEEHLASLSVDDYALLLKRFPSEMVAHVTRQGIRDHIGHVYHTVGKDAYSDSFMKMLDDGRLRSPLGVYLARGMADEAIAESFKLDEYDSKNEAEIYLNTLTDPEGQGIGGTYSDRMAIHFAAEEVADIYYGSEKGNEIFLAFPSAQIASQYHFSGDLTKRGGGYWNDQWVWANEERGMDIDSGLVFIPEDAKVDSVTGSRYELDKNKKPIINQEFIDSIKRVIDSSDFDEFAEKARKILGDFNQEWSSEKLDLRNKNLREKLEPFRQKIEQDFGITDKKLQRSILDYEFLLSLEIRRELEKKNPDSFQSYETEQDIMHKSLRERGILYREAKNSISSKEFWEKYFLKHPEKEPSKIVYYRGGDPTAALQEWKKKYGLRKKTESPDLGFPERVDDRSSPISTAGIDRFRNIAMAVIEKHFASREEDILAAEESEYKRPEALNA